MRLGLPFVIAALALPAASHAQEEYARHFDPGVMGPPTTPAIEKAALAQVSTPLAPGPCEATWESVAKNYRPPAWFEDAKFGIFLHWGLYAVPAYHNEWYEKHMYSAQAKWHEEHFGPLEKFGYKDFIPRFTCKNYDPAAWAELFRKSGARYVIPTAQHHDNFALWDSKLTKIDAKDMGPKRDLIGDLAAAVRKEGLKFGVSNHGIENFTFIEPEKSIRARLEAQKADLFDPEWAEFYHVADKSDAAQARFLGDWVERNLELIDKYQPDMLWFDNGANGAKNRELDQLKLRVAAHYYNRAKEWGREVSISTKGLAYAPSGDHLKQIGSIIDFEKIGNRSPAGIRPGPWQVDQPIGSTWGYTTGMKITGADRVISQLVDTVSKGGNLLLNLSPTAEGEIPKEQQATLLGIGKWLETNGEAIYGSRPWKQFGEDKLRFTTKGGALYLFVPGNSGAEVRVKALAGAKASGVSLLGSASKLEFSGSPEALVIKLPEDARRTPVAVLKITGEL
ncbi:alpha-L-fucosidase [Haloferula sp. BvORR071]|uniref:alpha-L-fucosidase n=1 Tax=Haloferula sp. BvORR071 TaxID=1396141 RepID=UPI0006987BF7|nr:alpha-L-fucosidase [Haloferula sp. BvORR071]